MPRIIAPNKWVDVPEETTKVVENSNGCAGFENIRVLMELAMAACTCANEADLGVENDRSLPSKPTQP